MKLKQSLANIGFMLLGASMPSQKADGQITREDLPSYQLLLKANHLKLMTPAIQTEKRMNIEAEIQKPYLIKNKLPFNMGAGFRIPVAGPLGKERHSEAFNSTMIIENNVGNLVMAPYISAEIDIPIVTNDNKYFFEPPLGREVVSLYSQARESLLITQYSPTKTKTMPMTNLEMGLRYQNKYLSAGIGLGCQLKNATRAGVTIVTDIGREKKDLGSPAFYWNAGIALKLNP